MTSKPFRYKAIAASAVALVLLPRLLAAEPLAGADLRNSASLEQDLEVGRAAASECLTLMEHDADEFLDCVEYRAAQQAQPAARLGALWYGWLMADIHDAHGLDGAERATRKLFVAADVLRVQLGIEASALCGLVSMSCGWQQARWRVHSAEIRP